MLDIMSSAWQGRREVLVPASLPRLMTRLAGDFIGVRLRNDIEEFDVNFQNTLSGSALGGVVAGYLSPELAGVLLVSLIGEAPSTQLWAPLALLGVSSPHGCQQ